MEALCLSFVCHPLCELLLFEPPPPEKTYGQVVVVLAGPGGWAYHSFCLLFAPHARAVALAVVVGVGVGVGVGVVAVVVVVVVVVIP